jgi:hypothetical protein
LVREHRLDANQLGHGDRFLDDASFRKPGQENITLTKARSAFSMHSVVKRDELQCLFQGNTITMQEYAAPNSKCSTAATDRACARKSAARHDWKDRDKSKCFCCGHFGAMELNWSDGQAAIPTLHPHRISGTA